MDIEEDIRKFNEFYDYAKATRDSIDFSFSFEKAVLMPDNEFSTNKLLNEWLRYIEENELL